MILKVAKEDTADHQVEFADLSQDKSAKSLKNSFLYKRKIIF
jgi:hypothetical protein